MSNIIKKIKIKKQDGTFTDYIPIGANAENVEMNNGESVEDIIGNIDLESKGNIEEQFELLYHTEPLNVLFYGAKANDDTFDNANIFQQAIDDGFIQQKPVYIPEGTFYISKPLKIYGADTNNNLNSGTIIYGSGKYSTTIIKNTNNILNNNLDFDEDCIFCICHGSAIHESSYVSGSASRINIMNLKIQGVSEMQQPKYGIYTFKGISTFIFKDLYITWTEIGAIYLKTYTYLGRMENIRASRTQYGIYAKDANTSLNLVNNYMQQCSVGAYCLSGMYSTINCCCADYCSGIIFDLSYFSGSIISPGSESDDALYGFKLRNCNVTITGGHIYGNKTNSNACLISIASHTRATFISTVFMAGTGLTSVPGKLYEASDRTCFINFINCSTNTYTEQGVLTNTSRVNYSSGYGAINFRSDAIPYLGYITESIISNDQDILTVDSKALNLTNGIYFGLGTDDGYFLEDGSYVRWNTSLDKGDIILFKETQSRGLLGYSIINKGTDFGTMSKIGIPLIQSGPSTDRPKSPAAIGILYFDTTLQKPVWCSNKGRRPRKVWNIPIESYQSLTQEAVLTMNINSETKTVTIPAN